MSLPQQAYDVQFTDVALKNLCRYPKQDQRRIHKRIEELAADPHAMRNVVIPFAAFEELRTLLTDEEKLADYLDYLHMQKIKEQQPAHLKLAGVKATLALD